MMHMQAQLLVVLPAERTSSALTVVTSTTAFATPTASTPYVSEASLPAGIFSLCPAFTASIQRGTSPFSPYRPIAMRYFSQRITPADRGKISSAALKSISFPALSHSRHIAGRHFSRRPTSAENERQRYNYYDSFSFLAFCSFSFRPTALPPNCGIALPVENMKESKYSYPLEKKKKAFAFSKAFIGRNGGI